MTYKFYKVKRQTECSKCRKQIRVRKHMILVSQSSYCLNCGSNLIETHRKHYKKEIERINIARRTLKRHTRERVALRLVE